MLLRVRRLLLELLSEKLHVMGGEVAIEAQVTCFDYHGNGVADHFHVFDLNVRKSEKKGGKQTSQQTRGSLKAWSLLELS